MISFVQLMITRVLHSFCGTCTEHLTLLVTNFPWIECAVTLVWEERSWNGLNPTFTTKKTVCDDWWCKIWCQRPSIWCSTGIGPWANPVLIVHFPLGNIVRHHVLKFHLYANNTQLYFAFRPTTAEQQSSLAGIEACVSQLIPGWSKTNWS